MKFIRNRGFRWILLMLGLFAIIALTGMNVLSLYDLRDSMVDEEVDRRIDQLDDINDSIRYQILEPLRGIRQLELEPIESTLQNSGQLPSNIQEILDRASQSPFFTGIYFTQDGVDPCNEGASIYQYNPLQKHVFLTSDYPDLICDGVGLGKTKTRIRLNDFDYRWNNHYEFDSHRSLNIGLINLNENRMIGVMSVVLNTNYIIEEAIPPVLSNYFGDSDESGIVVWVRDQYSDEILATNDSSIAYDRDLVNHSVDFSGAGFLDNWEFHLAFLESPISNVYGSTLIKNLFVLGVSVLFLMGSLIFMFVTAQRERNLAQRQASFLANVTHELKTPLAVMQAAGENISDGRVSEPIRLKQYGEHIHNESIRLRGMIEKLLDVARVDSGQTMIKAAPYRIHDLVTAYLNENRDYIERKGFEVAFKAKDKQSLTMIDTDSFDTILSNLTENAIKYSKDDKYIEYQVSSNKSHVFFSLTDHGIGIPKRAQKNIFNKFYRVEDSDTKSSKIKGHGLGLSIVENMVELNQGNIEVKSTLGKGTTFIVRFPKLMDDEVPEEKSHLSSVNNSSDSSTQKITNKNSEYVG